jgi:effector-binding domain-containing protein
MSLFRAACVGALMLSLTPAAAIAQAPENPAAQKAQEAGEARPADDFGVEIELPEKTVAMLSGKGSWDGTFDTVVEAFRTLHDYLDKEGLQAGGEAMIIYTTADENGFGYQAMVPIGQAPAGAPPEGIEIGKSPSGKAYSFVHRGSYEGMENTYEAITNFFEEKDIEPKEVFIEQYVTDPRDTPESDLVINVLVPVK